MPVRNVPGICSWAMWENSTSIKHPASLFSEPEAYAWESCCLGRSTVYLAANKTEHRWPVQAGHNRIAQRHG